jgi:catalase
MVTGSCMDSEVIHSVLSTQKNERVWVRFHFISQQGIKNFTNDEAVKMKGEDPDFAQRDLVEAIDKGDFPKWALKVQIMTEEQARTYK